MLIVVDDTTGKVVSTRFSEREDARSYCPMIRTMVEHHGVPPDPLDLTPIVVPLSMLGEPALDLAPSQPTGCVGQRAEWDEEALPASGKMVRSKTKPHIKSDPNGYESTAGSTMAPDQTGNL